jgi:hypothetical protein
VLDRGGIVFTPGLAFCFDRGGPRLAGRLFRADGRTGKCIGGRGLRRRG